MLLLTQLKRLPTFLTALPAFMALLFFMSLTAAPGPIEKQSKDSFYQNSSARDLGDSLDLLLNGIKQTYGAKTINLTVGIVKDGRVFLKKHYGYSNPETGTPFSNKTQIYIASTSKSLTGTFAAILDQKGIIKLDKTLADYLPELTFDDQRIHPDQITMRALITHTHGIKNNDAVVWTAFIGIHSTQQLLALLKKYSTALPNRAFNYSNLGPVIYAMVAEKQLGKPWQQAMDEQLFRPLGMTATTAYVSKANPRYISYIIDHSAGKMKSVFDKADNSMSAAGGHLTTVNDMLKYLQFFISEGHTVPGLLDKQALSAATAALVPQQSRYQSYDRYGYGLGWEQSTFNGTQLVSRFGGYSGISAHLSFIKAQKTGIVVVSNDKGMEALAHLVANYSYNTLLNKENKHEILKENLLSLQKNFGSDAQENKEIMEAAAQKIEMPANLLGRYDGGEKSGTMEIAGSGKVSWGNLRGQLHLLSDSTGLINFQTMVRSFSIKRTAGSIAGIYSNDRYFKR